MLGVGIGRVFPIAKVHAGLPMPEIDRLLDSSFYEVRMAAAAIMDFQARQKTPANPLAMLYELYLGRHDRLNNWDLVDRAAPYVVGQYLDDKPRDPLYDLASSPDPWRRRTAIVATYYFIRKGDLHDTFAICALAGGRSARHGAEGNRFVGVHCRRGRPGPAENLPHGKPCPPFRNRDPDGNREAFSGGEGVLPGRSLRVPEPLFCGRSSIFGKLQNPKNFTSKTACNLQSDYSC
ncbi:DNA alkylation repair protein [Rhizobium sp. RCAM05350]|nr:DNA alkylation repair protein [Rhizobium sp. RCAM05350]